MDEGKRPGGLTALAVINFVFAGFGLLGILGMIVILTFVGAMSTEGMNETQKAQFEAFQDMGLPLFIVVFGLEAVSSVLLLVSGIGYLKQKKIIGWALGNAYAVLAIISSIVSAFLFAAALGGGFNIGTMINLIYPLVTLFLLNTTFKEDFVN